MRFKLDENLPLELAAELRAMGYDTDTVADEGLRGEPGPVVVEAASNADRILLTLDKGIADVRSQGRTAMVVFRPDSAVRRAVLCFVRERISGIGAMDLAGRVTVVGPSRIRQRYIAQQGDLPLYFGTLRLQRGQRVGHWRLRSTNTAGFAPQKREPPWAHFHVAHPQRKQPWLSGCYTG